MSLKMPSLNVASTRPSRWGQERRLEFIEFRLLWEGRINRGQITDHFGVSIQQASTDLARYLALAPGNVEYDRRDKVYKSTPSFTPVLVTADAHSFLTQLQSVAVGTSLPTATFIGWKPPHDVLRIPTRRIRPQHLVIILRAIRDQLDIEVSYQSMREDAAVRRFITPHAIAFDAARWHVRAWCYRHNEFRDFTIARIQDIYNSRPSNIDPATDHAWQTQSTVVLRPRSELTASQRAAIESEFGMHNGELRATLRRAMIFYFIKELQLLPDQKPSVRAQPLEWVNQSEFTELLSSFRK